MAELDKLKEKFTKELNEDFQKIDEVMSQLEYFNFQREWLKNISDNDCSSVIDLLDVVTPFLEFKKLLRAQLMIMKRQGQSILDDFFGEKDNK